MRNEKTYLSKKNIRPKELYEIFKNAYKVSLMSDKNLFDKK